MTPQNTLQTTPMEHTLTLETRALKAASRQWKELSPEIQRMINMRTLFVHRTAPLIQDVEFTRLPGGENGACRPARLHVGVARPPGGSSIVYYLLGSFLPVRNLAWCLYTLDTMISPTLVMQSMTATRLKATTQAASPWAV